ncbi:hypothetical protein PYW07_006172 [Mythimna separata]|uniref:Protein kinase domain-containing protein n=1 Tax=Mythimna separata TaxID=271217 RepID=A0AAD7YU08_MYTSE|nr:hypothetical protein PYW07_006172 [Mythimna separata]
MPGSLVLLALALLLRAAVSADSSCARLAAARSAEARGISLDGVPRTVLLAWGSAPARAAAAQLSALLRHVHGYAGVRLAHSAAQLDTASLANSVLFLPNGNYSEYVIGVSTAWRPWRWQQLELGPALGLAGPRLAELGASPVPARRRLHARLAPPARAAPHCRACARWPFYADQLALARCDFLDATRPLDRTVDVLVVDDRDEFLKRPLTELLEKLQQRAVASNVSLNVTRVRRAELLAALHNATRSFLFLDYDMWRGAAGVRAVDAPPCVSDDYECEQQLGQLDSAVAVRVADVNALQTCAPQLLRFVLEFKPPPESLRLILEQEASGVDIEEAACEWTLNDKTFGNQTLSKLKYTLPIYLCDDNMRKQYELIATKVGNLIEYTIHDFDINFNRFVIDCSKDDAMSEKINRMTKYNDIFRLLGVVAVPEQGAAAAAVTAAAARVPLLLSGVTPDAAARSAWRVGGRARHVALALRHWVREAGWARVAVLSQDSALAADYQAAFDDDALNIRPFPLKGRRIEAVLQDLRETNARIVFLNTEPRAAVAVLSAAAAAGMGYSDGYVWVLREPLEDEAIRMNKVMNDTKHFTVSFLWRGVDGVPFADGWKPLDTANLTALLQQWPPRALAFVDAIVSLVMGFWRVFLQHPELRHDLRNDKMIRLLQESLTVNPVMGVGRRLHYAERSIEEAFVFVDQWRGGLFERRLATWRVNASSGAVRGPGATPAAFTRPSDLPRDDGTSGCTVRSGDRFAPDCHDSECAVALLLLALAPGAALLARRALRRRLARLQRERELEVMARRRHVVAVLAAYLVERGALELREELGAGRFGSVCRARLCQPGRAPRFVAAKALRDSAAPAEESEFLREACMIASLEHAHVVRLVGVCIADGPPLVLMELAFFGDLLGYLRERRHLVEDAGAEEPAAGGEAEHVSAEALTRLAREAAAALQYLGARGVVHRDVRAANCLVDVRRALKLADFGMARDTVAGADGAPEYACRRRGLFPVLWMAPESLAHGVFSAASDVWALGVLVLELVTLGVRPYGSMSPLRVLEYVAAGGSPPLPLDATPQTRGLVRLCWERAAERRPSAGEVAAYLLARPHALRPALLSERDEPADVDSGFGESPSTELLPPDSPLNCFDQLDDIAATH